MASVIGAARSGGAAVAEPAAAPASGSTASRRPGVFEAELMGAILELDDLLELARADAVEVEVGLG